MRDKYIKGMSHMRRALIYVFNLRGGWLVQHIGNAHSVRVGHDTWIKCSIVYKLLEHMIAKLEYQGIIVLIQINDLGTLLQ